MSKSYFYLILIFLGLQTVSPATAEVVLDVSPIALDAQESQPEDSTLNADTPLEVLAQSPALSVASTANPIAETDLLSADLSADLLIPTPLLSQAIAEQSAPKPAETIDALAQSTPVSQLQDIDARHWAAQALRQLSQRYNCLPNYFTEEAILTRYEFADILYTCMEVVNQAILDSTAENASQEDLAVVQRLQEEFQAELAVLSERVDSIEAQIDTLEDQQFVKRTTLFGIAEFVALDTFGNSLPDQPGRAVINPQNANTTFTAGNLFLDIDAKVRGKDFVRTELFVTNTPSNNRNNTGTDMTRFDVLPEQSDFNLNYLFYQMKFAKRGVLRVGPVGLIANHIIPDLSPTQAPSRFGRRNPIYRPAAGGGFLANYQVNDWLGVGAGYTVGGTDAFTPEKGFFNGQNRFIAQATFTPTPKLGLGLTYSHLYQHAQVPITGRTGSRNAQAPFGDSTATTAHLLSFSGNYRINKRVGIGGWIGYNQATAADD
ncbi:MAG: iron uptake porin, partial [Prochlorotrichaceae cyanobacterium]